MEKILQISAIIIFCLFNACNNSLESKNNGIAAIKFSETEFDFGNINPGEKVAHRFVFKNTGKGDLIIKNVEPSCGCTVASFPDEPVKPGQESYIETTFDSEGFTGLNIKEIEVYTNCEPAVIKLTISAAITQNI
jgi:hypothetical protein